MQREIKSKQRKVRILNMILSASSTAITGPDALQATLVNTSTGVNTVTLNQAFGATTQYTVSATSATPGAPIVTVSITSANVFVVNTYNTSGSATAGATHVQITGSDITSQY
jgi:hypothetical protein